MKSRTVTVGFAIVTMVAAFIAGTAFGQQVGRGRTGPPAQREGGTNELLATLDLGPEIACLQGRQLTLTATTWAPGGSTVLHRHEDCCGPIVGMIVEGTMTEHQQDGTVIDLKAGQAFSEGKAVHHWVENRTTAPAKWVLASITLPTAAQPPPSPAR